MILARKISSKFFCCIRRLGLETTGYRSIKKRVKLFESRNSESFSILNNWLREHPEHCGKELCQLEAGKYKGENVLVISPHPDDEIIGCGGTLIKMVQEGVKVTVLHLTDGSGSEALKNSADDIRKTIRLEEAKKVAQSLGVEELIAWRLEDGKLCCEQKTVEMLVEILKRLKPRIIFVPFINDCHKDHIAACIIVKEALKSAALNLDEIEVLSYEIWSFVPVNCYCVINKQLAGKIHLLEEYRTAMKVVDYVSFCESLGLYRSFTLLGRKGAVEAFFAVNGQKYIRVVES